MYELAIEPEVARLRPFVHFERLAEGARAIAMPDSAYPIPTERTADFTDLTIADGAVYALVRNAYLIVRLDRAEQRWTEREAFSYAGTENDLRYAYADLTYGLAEGLAITSGHGSPPTCVRCCSCSSGPPEL